MTVPGGQEQDVVLSAEQIAGIRAAVTVPSLTGVPPFDDYSPTSLLGVLDSHEVLRAEAESLRQALRDIDSRLTTAEGDNVTMSHAAAVHARELARAALAAADATQERNADAAAAGGGRQ